MSFNLQKSKKQVIHLIMNTAETDEQIKDLLIALRATDWDKERRFFDKKNKKICPNCGKIFSGKPSFCPKCNSDWNRNELRIVQSQNRRAINRSAKGILTFGEWMKTLNDFNHKCAYCQQAGYEVLEHFIPIGKEGGDTANWNCVPACYRCNWLKKGRNPLKTRNMRIPKQDIERVKIYLQQNRKDQ